MRGVNTNDSVDAFLLARTINQYGQGDQMLAVGLCLEDDCSLHFIYPSG